jgi:O-antigen/teichoic acid export membrane protein
MPFERQTSLARRLLSGSLWVVGARIIGALSTILVNVLLARRLAPEDFGDFVVICSVATAASLFAMFGLNSAVVRFVADQLARGNRTAAREVLHLCLRLAALMTAAVAVTVLLGMYGWGSVYLKVADPGYVACLTACALALLAFCNLGAAALRSLGEMSYSSLLGGQAGGGPLGSAIFLATVCGLTIATQMSLISALTAYVASFGVVLVVGGFWLSSTASTVFTDGGRQPEVQAPSPQISASALLTTCFPMLLVQVLAAVARQGGLWVAGASCSSDEMALYAGATRAILLVAIPLSLINLSVMSFIPQLRAQGRLPELEHVLRISAGWAAIPSFAALLAFTIAPAPILELFLGPYYRGAAGIVALMSFGQFVFVWAGSSELTLVLSGHARAAATVNAVAAIVVIAGGTILARQYGAQGLAGLVAAVVAGQSLSQWLLARRLVGIWTHATLLPWRSTAHLR